MKFEDQIVFFKYSYMNPNASINAVSGAPVVFKSWCGHQYRVGIISPPPVEIGLGWLPKLGVDMSPRPHAHRRACSSNMVGINCPP